MDNNKPWWFLYRREGFHHVWIYEQLWGKELNRRKKAGWRVIE